MKTIKFVPFLYPFVPTANDKPLLHALLHRMHILVGKSGEA